MVKGSLSKRCAIIELHKAGHGNSEIGKLLGCSRQTVARQIKRYKELGSMEDRPRSGRPKSSKVSMARIAVAAEMAQNPEASLRKIAKELEVSATTVCRIVKNELNIEPHYNKIMRIKGVVKKPRTFKEKSKDNDKTTPSQSPEESIEKSPTQPTQSTADTPINDLIAESSDDVDTVDTKPTNSNANPIIANDTPKKPTNKDKFTKQARIKLKKSSEKNPEPKSMAVPHTKPQVFPKIQAPSFSTIINPSKIFRI